jgi:ATP/maltotriose-dependent transcriptional regulator MalT
MEGVSAGNLMTVHLFAGRWQEAERLAAELLDGSDARAGAAYANYPMVILHVLRGETEGARASLDRLVAWEHSEDEEHQAMQSSAKISLLLATGHPEEALEHGRRLLGHVIEALGASNESVRNAWPDTLQAALALARTEDARGLLGLLAERPAGHIPPYLDAQLARGRALLAAAEGRHDTVEGDLIAAILGFRALGYPYWLAVAQTDLGAWLIGQDQASDAAALLDEATTTLESLGAAPMLVRAQRLSHSRTGAVAS